MTDVLRLGDVEVKVHPAAELFPMMSDPELEELAADIAKNELQQPIVYVRDELLDGRNRIAAIARIRDERRREDCPARRPESHRRLRGRGARDSRTSRRSYRFAPIKIAFVTSFAGPRQNARNNGSPRNSTTCPLP